ncbi:MAG: ATP-binding protein [Pseudomonadota bacterium]
MMRMIRNLGIGQRILLSFTIPMLLVILTLGYRITSGYMTDARNALEARGAHMARQLAALCEFGLYAQDPAELQRQLDSVAREEDVVTASVSDANGRVLARSGTAELPDAPQQSATFRAIVMRTGVSISDFEAETAAATVHSPENPELGQVTLTLSTTGLLENLRNTFISGSILTFTGLLATFLLAYLVARSVSAPIRHLTGIVGKLTGGDLAARSRQGSPGELGSLEAGINQMANTLQHAQGKLAREIEDATAALQHTVTELEHRNIELNHARDEAVRAAAAKTDFLARMSHEIRTPLSAIIGFNELLGKTRLTENQQEYSRTINQAAAQLLQVIEDILGYSRLESGAVKLELSKFNLHDCLENVVSMLSATAHEKQLELVLYIHSDVPRFIISDQNRISQVLTNLAANAIKFTETGHVIVEISVPNPEPDDVTIMFAVTDTGIGMNETQLGQIFSPFYQADDTASRRHGGTGLGLSISKQLVEQLGGAIQVSSKQGTGSVFSFTLNSPRIDQDGNVPAKILAGKTICVFDRNPFSLRALRNRFFTWGATVFNTSDPDRLQEMLATLGTGANPCDLVVAGIGGAEFERSNCAGLCRTYALAVPVPRLFLVSAELEDPATDSNCREHCRILSKPVRSDLLLRTVRTLIMLPDEAGTSIIGATPGQPAQEARPASAGLEVLVVEDNHFNQELLSQILAELGVRATLAANGSEACAVADVHRFDIIFMDIHMPVMGGLEAARYIRQGINRDTPIIALTADVFTDQNHALASAGIDDCLLKPVSATRLTGMLDTWGRPGARAAASAGTATLSAGMAQAATAAGSGLPPEFHQRLHRELVARLQALRLAHAAGDEAAIRDHVHQLKGIVDFFQLVDFHEAFRLLQTALQSRQAAAAETAIDRLQAVLAETSPETGEWRQERERQP